MQFDVNSPLLYIIVGAVLATVAAQSIVFLIRAVKRARELGLGDRVKKTVLSSAVFSIVPAISILLGVIVLERFLGLPIPWFRLSILGSLTYEQTAALAAAQALGADVAQTVTDPKVFTTILWVMSVGIIPGIFLVLFALKRIQNGIVKIKSKDSKWSTILMSALFVGMISCFLGGVFGKVQTGLVGWIPVFVFAASAIIMVLCAGLMKLLKWDWLENYALPISMLGAMALSIPITNAVNAAVGG